MISQMYGGFIPIVEMPRGKSPVIKKEPESPRQTYEEYVRERLNVEKLLRR